jgi:hypothetical protein
MGAIRLHIFLKLVGNRITDPFETIFPRLTAAICGLEYLRQSEKWVRRKALHSAKLKMIGNRLAVAFAGRYKPPHQSFDFSSF